MASTDPDLTAVLDKLDRNMTRIFGGSGGFLGKKDTDPDEQRRNMSAFGQVVKSTTNSVRNLHSSFEEATHKLTGSLAKFGEIGIAIGFAVKGLMDLTKSYNQLADVGEHFGGSIFEMARVAGQAGLSLDEFAKAMGKSGAVAALLSTNMVGAASGWSLMQKTVRDNLKEYGFLGMSLSQLTDYTFEYANVLRLTSRLTKLGSVEAGNAATQFLKNISTFSAISGASRDELVKSVTDFLKKPEVSRYVGSLSPEAQAFFEKQSAYLTSLDAGGATGGKELRDFLYKTMEKQDAGQTAFNTEQGRFYTGAGLSGVTEKIDFIARNRNVMSESDIAKEWKSILPLINARLSNEQRGSLTEEQISRLSRDIQGLMASKSAEEVKRDMERAALTRPFDAITKLLLTFHSDFETAAGGIRNRFYGGIIGGLSGQKFGGPELNKKAGETDAQFEKRRMAETDKFFDLQKGQITTAAGMIVRFAENDEQFAKRKIKTEQEYTEKYEKKRQEFADNLGKISETLGGWLGSLMGWVVETKALEKAAYVFENIFNVVSNVFKTVKGSLEKLGIGPGWAAAITTGLAYMAYKIITRGIGEFFRIGVRNGVINIAHAVGMGTKGTTLGGGGGPTIIPPSSTTAAKKGIWSRLMEAIGLSKNAGAGAGRSMGGRILGLGGKLFKGGLIGGVVAFLLEQAVSAFGEQLIGAKATGIITGILGSNTAMLAGIGMMFGPWGALIGGAIGLAIDAVMHWKDLKEQILQPFSVKISEWWDEFWSWIIAKVHDLMPSWRDLQRRYPNWLGPNAPWERGNTPPPIAPATTTPVAPNPEPSAAPTIAPATTTPVAPNPEPSAAPTPQVYAPSPPRNLQEYNERLAKYKADLAEYERTAPHHTVEQDDALKKEHLRLVQEQVELAKAALMLQQQREERENRGQTPTLTPTPGVH